MRPLFCTFCRKEADEVAKLVAGPGVHICDACVGLCVDAIEARPLPTPAFAGWDSLGDEALSKALARSEVAVELARDVLQSQIDVMRGRGKSWADVGAALGVSRQAAWERFG